MNIWLGIKQLNRHVDRWSARAVNRVVASLDHAGDPQQKAGRAPHISMWGLLRGNRVPSVTPAAKEK